MNKREPFHLLPQCFQLFFNNYTFISRYFPKVFQSNLLHMHLHTGKCLQTKSNTIYTSYSQGYNCNIRNRNQSNQSMLLINIFFYFQELLTRSSLETHKLDLMAEISSLKIRLATADNERRELEEKFRQSQVCRL